MKWRLAAAMRAHNRLQIRKNLIIEAGPRTVPVGPEDIDTLEDILATLQHPIGLADAILDVSARGDLVLDSFLGSGSTLIAADRQGI